MSVADGPYGIAAEGTGVGLRLLPPSTHAGGPSDYPCFRLVSAFRQRTAARIHPSLPYQALPAPASYFQDCPPVVHHPESQHRHR